MSIDDPVDSTSLIFTEGEAYMLGGYLATLWGMDEELNREEIVNDTEEAIKNILANTNT